MEHEKGIADAIAGIAGSVSRWVALEERLRWRGAVKTVRIS